MAVAASAVLTQLPELSSEASAVTSNKGGGHATLGEIPAAGNAFPGLH